MSKSRRAKLKKDAGGGATTGGGGGGGGGGILDKIRSAMGNNRTENMTAWEILTKHPLVYVGKFIAVPYVLYLGYYYLRLQHPEYISTATLGLVNLRPAVYRTDTPRQVLIVATPGSGTVQMASELRSKLSLEVGHESSDAAWDFTRDGSVSWFHGIRFLTEPADDRARIESWAKICNSDIETHSNMGFHPAMYGPPRKWCSYRSKWDKCWQNECYMTLMNEWGCATTNTCDINFATNIHQVRNPMNSLESLVTKFCVGGLEGTVAEPFMTYASALFPKHDFSADSCIEATGTFMVMYLEAMVSARMRGHLDGFYQIEQSSACDVAKAAGMFDPNTTVYEPNHERISKLCDPNNTESPAQKKAEQKLNKVNNNQVRLVWDDLLGGRHGSKKRDGDSTLQRRVKTLMAEFGYDDKIIPRKHLKPAGSDEL